MQGLCRGCAGISIRVSQGWTPGRTVHFRWVLRECRRIVRFRLKGCVAALDSLRLPEVVCSLMRNKFPMEGVLLIWGAPRDLPQVEFSDSLEL